MTGWKRREIRPVQCATEGCENNTANENMRVCDECFRKLYDRWAHILFTY